MGYETKRPIICFLFWVWKTSLFFLKNLSSQMRSIQKEKMIEQEILIANKVLYPSHVTAKLAKMHHKWKFVVRSGYIPINLATHSKWFQNVQNIRTNLYWKLIWSSFVLHSKWIRAHSKQKFYRNAIAARYVDSLPFEVNCIALEISTPSELDLSRFYFTFQPIRPDSCTFGCSWLEL